MMRNIKFSENNISGRRLHAHTKWFWIAVLCAMSLGCSAWAVRGRPHLDTTLGYNVLLSDNDTLLRGVSLSWDGGDPYNYVDHPKVMPSQAQLDALATDYGLNTVHLYLEGDSTGNTDPIGYNKTDCDTLVQRCAAADLYLIITIGCNGENGTMDLTWSQDFWDFYAPLYKDETHVIYEAHNEPVGGNLSSWSNADWNDQVTLYDTIRANAPDTFILLGSFMSFYNWSLHTYGATYIAGSNYYDKATNDIWDNAGFAYHGYEDPGNIENTIIPYEASTSYPALLCTEFWPGDTISQNYNSMFESHFNGWMQFQWLGASDWDMLSFKSKIEASGTVWTPDVATCNWPANGTLDIPTDGSTLGIFSHSELLYLTADPANSNDLVAEAENYTGTGTDAFIIEHTGPRLVSFKAANGQYVSATSSTDSLTANTATAGNTEKFEWLRLLNGDVALRAYGGGGYLAYANDSTGLVYPALKKAWYLPGNFMTVDTPGGPLAPLPVLTGSPYSGSPLAIGPGTTVIEAEYFDLGGESVGYHDNDEDNRGNGNRQAENVDIETCSDTGYGYNVGFINIEERLYYTVDVTTAPGDYTLTARVATENNGAAFRIWFNNIYKTNLAVPNTNGWQAWTNTATAVITLDSGPQIMTFIRMGVEVYPENFDFNLNKFTLEYIGGNGDMDLDGDIDLVDYALFAPYWQQTGCGTCGGAELTGDGNVLIEDLVAFCDNWLGGL